MDHFDILKKHIRSVILLTIIINSLFSAVIFWFGFEYLQLDILIAAGVALVSSVVLCLFSAQIVTKTVMEPLKFIWQAVLHISPEHGGTPAPNLQSARVGRELVTSLVQQIYQLASHLNANNKEEASHRIAISQSANIVSHLPLPLFVFNKEQLVTNASESAVSYCGVISSELFGRPLYESVDLEFPSERTLEKWVEDCQKHKVTDTEYWERVRVRVKNEENVTRQCDMAAYYNRDNPSGTEFIITMFDRSARYAQDDQSLNFVALAVHELRTPLTILRGYIEALEEELEGKLDDELAGFMNKLQVASAQLNAFVNNILNVARIQENQLSLHLSEETWKEVLSHAIEDLDLKSRVHDKTIEFTVQENLPSVAVDKVSICEVINNLVDNAIKYSGKAKKIIIDSRLGDDGMVITTVQDFGAGIEESVLPNLFEKYYRSHQTKAQVGGTGLGLYLSKAIVGAHGGQIWASSKPNEGSTFGFSLKPYAELAQEQKQSGNTEITHNAHGWIKNHSLYRR